MRRVIPHPSLASTARCSGALSLPFDDSISVLARPAIWIAGAFSLAIRSLIALAFL
ncbi:hypothetical protein [Ramlibacter sp. AN1133]|uniref:hypothetical protein n=1 Tax=Ramlibacter sp. AN1133 TaxID=3133429 RepID=UPI0030C116E5